LHFDGSIHILKLEGASGLQRIGLVKFFVDGETRNGPGRGQNEDEQPERSKDRSKHNVLPPSKHLKIENRAPERNSRAAARVHWQISATEN
jgi:hypothetical protein